MTRIDRAPIEQTLLIHLFDCGVPMSVSDLETSLGCTRRDLWCAVRAQALLGNVKRGTPICLTASARVAIAAGRSSGAAHQRLPQ